MIPDIQTLDDGYTPDLRTPPLEAVMRIEGSVALVTGANRGIGRALAEELLARGAAKVYRGCGT